MAGLKSDANGNIMQGFTPTRAQSITATSEWTPTVVDRAFCVPEDCTYVVNGAGSSMTLLAGAIRVIRSGYTYTLDTTMVIEVM